MAGVKGEITKAQKGGQKSVYLSDVFGVWPEGDALHIAFLKRGTGEQSLHTSITKKDGLLYDVFLMLYHLGQATG